MPEKSTQSKTALAVESSDLLAIYDVLELCANAPASLRDEFVRSIQGGTKEFRFGGSLAFGGKYWPETNTVNCYREDLTERRRAIITDTNGHLAHLANAKFTHPRVGGR